MKKFTILMSLFALTLMAGSAFAGLLDTTITTNTSDTRPEGLKAQVDTMKLEVPKRFQCLVDTINNRYPDSDDADMKLFVLKKNVKAYWNIREADYPQNVLVEVLARYECDFDMVEFLVKKQIKAAGELADLLN